ncbi:transporter substrate-binding domain-containing protein [Legionella impletisoli]|uniref:Uncharacterized protein n=1 Tax=Legionella impletisoli TaxID=343510 RepID=A0A917JYX0_9GAMM|nr:transporter substrate-binding domain-containing protein [Legionella impletisoli]GGI93488.1 hypothetical protein GCM10007966_22580 [Legionella impletisoli]
MTFVPNLEEGVNLLETKQVEGVVANYVSLKYLLRDKVRTYGLQELIIGSTELAFAVKNPQTLKQINEALTELQDKNEIYPICKQWLDNDAKLCLI